MNCTIGRWTDKSLKIKQELIKYIFEEKSGIIAQEASLPHDKRYLSHPRYWEYSTAIELTNPKNHTILDVGGLNNIIGWFLKDKYNCFIHQVGLNPKDWDNLHKNKERFGTVGILGSCVDVRKFESTKQYDIVFSFNVIEHVREYAKAEKNKSWKIGHSTYWGQASEAEEYAAQKEVEFVQSMVKFVKPGGILCITFDYCKHGNWKPQGRCAYMRSVQDINNRIVIPSKLKILGDSDFETIYPTDCHPNASTGIIVLKKEKENG